MVRAGGAGKEIAQDGRVVLGVAAQQRSQGRALDAVVFGLDRKATRGGASAVGIVLESRRRGGQRDFVEPIVGVEGDDVFGVEAGQDTGHAFGHARVESAYKLPPYAGRIAKRPEDIEEGPHSQLSSNRHHETHRRMEERREDKGDSSLA